MQTYGVPHYMKIDIEGADLVCVEALRYFAFKPHYLSIESEKIVFEDLLRELDLLSGLRYVEFAAVQQANVHKTIAPIPSSEGKSVSHTFPRGSSGVFGRDIIEGWMSRDELIKRYEEIFADYRRFGDSTLWQENRVANLLLAAASRATGRPIPGWYDTHARHASGE